MINVIESQQSEIYLTRYKTSITVLMRRLILLFIMCIGTTVYAQPSPSLKSDTLNLRFRLDSIKIDMSYADNASHWQTFIDRFESYAQTRPSGQILIDIYSGASPEGTAVHNRWLGEQRGQTVRRMLRRQFGDRVGRIVVHNEAARWDGFYDLVAASGEPWRDEVLRIIEMEASADERQRDHREQKLRALHGGTVWPVLLERYLAPLRSGATAVLSWQNDTIVMCDTVVMLQPVVQGPQTAVAKAPRPKTPKPLFRQPVWILRSNLLLLGAGTPNLQAEFPLGRGDRWSINVEGVFSWWTFSYNKYANQIIYGSVELRYWLGNRKRHHTLSGWHLGLAVGGGYGDLEWKSKGYQAEVYSAFVNVGWQHRFGRRRQWAFDAGIGLGYAYVPWRRYTGSRLFPEGHEEVHDDHLMWRETGRNNWIGTPHLNISIGYVFPLYSKTSKRVDK